MLPRKPFTKDIPESFEEASDILTSDRIQVSRLEAVYKILEQIEDDTTERRAYTDSVESIKEAVFESIKRRYKEIDRIEYIQIEYKVERLEAKIKELKAELKTQNP